MDLILVLRGLKVEEITEVLEISKGLHSLENGDAEKHGVAKEWMQARSLMKWVSWSLAGREYHALYILLDLERSRG